MKLFDNNPKFKKGDLITFEMNQIKHEGIVSNDSDERERYLRIYIRGVQAKERFDKLSGIFKEAMKNICFHKRNNVWIHEYYYENKWSLYHDQVNPGHSHSGPMVNNEEKDYVLLGSRDTHLCPMGVHVMDIVKKC